MAWHACIGRSGHVVLLFFEPAGEEVQRLERPAEGSRRRRHLEPRRRHHVDGRGGGAHDDVVKRRHAEVVQLPQRRVLRPAERLSRRHKPSSTATLCVVAWTDYTLDIYIYSEIKIWKL